LNQPIYRIFAITFVLLVKSLTAFIGFMLFAVILFYQQPEEDSFPSSLEEVGEILSSVVEDFDESVNAEEFPAVDQEVDISPDSEVAALPSFDSYQEPDGCFYPVEDYTRIEVNGWEINSRTLSMLDYAQQLFGEDIQLTGTSLIQGSYDQRASMASTPFSGGGAVGIAIMNPVTGEILTPDLQGLIQSLRTAGFAAWLRGVDELYPGSPMMIEAIAVGDQELNNEASSELFAEYGYFFWKNGLPGEAMKADSHGGPVVCRWMLEAGFGGTALEMQEAEPVSSTFEEESHAARLDPASINREARQLRIVPDPLSFPVSGYSGETSFDCIAPADSSVISGVFGEQRGEFIHAGIDFAQCSRVGFAVFTPMGGQVTFSDFHELYGYVVVVENDGWQVILAHNLADLVRVGDIVEAGQVVALSGNSGNSGGPHIHFEVRYCEDGVLCRPLDPSEVLLPGQDSLCVWETLALLECPSGN